MESRRDKRRREAEWRKQEWRKEKRRTMPAAEGPSGVVELAGHDGEEWVLCIVPLPGGDRVATASGSGKVRVFAVATGALEHELDAHDGYIGGRSLAALGGDIIVSGGYDDRKVVTWNAARGERLGEAAAGSGVEALAALDGWRFVAGARGGDVVFYSHHGGRRVEETARIAGAHNDLVRDFAVCGGRLATASDDKTAAVWGVDSRKLLALLSGHTDCVRSVDMNDRLVATASDDSTVRVYNAERDFSCTAVLDWLHTAPVCSAAIIGDDNILSASYDRTVCVAQVSSNTVVARTEQSYEVYYAAGLPDGRLAVCGWCGNAALIDAPAAAAEVLKAHSAAAIPGAAAAASVLAVAGPLPPLQDAVVRVATGELTAAAACRDLISCGASSASLAEWSAGHLLLMQAVRGGEIEASQSFKSVRNYWFAMLYAPSRKLCLGTDDYEVVKRLLEEAKAVGVIETVEASLAAIASHSDLRVNVNELRSAGEQMLRAFAHIFMGQADMEERLCQLENVCERFKRVQQWTQLANIFVCLIPFTGGGIAGTASAFEGMQISNVIESLLGVATVAQAAATSPMFGRFLSCGNDLLSEGSLAVIPVGARFLLEKVASKLGVSIEGLRQILKVTAQRMVEDGENGCPPVRVDVSDVDELRDPLEGATMHERQSDPGSILQEAQEKMGDIKRGDIPVEPVDEEVNMVVGEDGDEENGVEGAKPPAATLGIEYVVSAIGVTGKSDPVAGGGDSDVELTGRTASTLEAGRDTEQPGPQAAEIENVDFALLKSLGVSRAVVVNLGQRELSVYLAAYLVMYERSRQSEYENLQQSILVGFRKTGLDGEALAGSHMLESAEFVDTVWQQLGEDELAKVGYKVKLFSFAASIKESN
jgi:WD domain, G-beta repeat